MYAHSPYKTAYGQPTGRLQWPGPALRSIALGAAFALTLATPPPVLAKTFHCGAEDVLCLIAAISEANTNGEKENRIVLEAGNYTLTAADNSTDGPNGLPSITGSLDIMGAGANTTTIERPASSPPLPSFRLMHVAATGDLTLEGLTLRGGSVFGFIPANFMRGGGLFNNGGTVTVSNSVLSGNSIAPFGEGGGLYNADGMVTLTNSILSDNRAFGGGGIWNTPGGSIIITHSTLANNLGSAAGGGILNDAGGTVTITDSTIASNMSFDPGLGAGIRNGGTVTITNSTLSANHGRSSGGISNYGMVTVTNSTLSGNSGQASGGIATGGMVTLQNTILALNSAFLAPDCSGVTSFGNNLIGTTTNCSVTLQSSDLTGDPGLAAFTDDGTPGNGHYPLLATSRAIDAGNDAVCPKRDQLGNNRHHPCDIGAIEFPDHP